MLKERAFGLTGDQGNRGEDVKEYYVYRDATPTHSFLRYLYKYPQRPFPYERLVEENARRSRLEPPFNLADAGAFAEDRYFDVEVVYAKAAPDAILIRISATNRGPEAAELHLLPTLWFRNTWSWADGASKPAISVVDPLEAAVWAIEASHDDLGCYRLTGRQAGALLFTDNDSNNERLWGGNNATPFVKDAFHRHVIESATDAINPARTGTKFALWRKVTLAPGERAEADLVL
ncbi:MAG: glucosidase, partial [Hyphomicrobiales bacterium]|nr:glucosidase [Hyphomicrobiales bacterium]